MGRVKDLATDTVLHTAEQTSIEISPVQYIVVDDTDFDVDEVNYQLQMAADEARNKD